MTKSIKYIILLLLISISMFSCNPTKKILNDNLYTVSISSIYNLSIDTLSLLLMDSLTTVDNLPQITNWEKLYLKDDETNEYIEYSTLYDRTSNIIYTVKYNKKRKQYIVKKRQTNK